MSDKLTQTRSGPLKVNLFHFFLFLILHIFTPL